MRRDIEHPVTDNEQRNGRGRRGAGPAQHHVDRRRGDRPNAQRGEAVRVRIADEIERRHDGDTGRTSTRSSPSRTRLGQIRSASSHRREQHAERHRGRRPLGTQGDAEMTDEHESRDDKLSSVCRSLILAFRSIARKPPPPVGTIFLPSRSSSRTCPIRLASALCRGSCSSLPSPRRLRRSSGCAAPPRPIADAAAITAALVAIAFAWLLWLARPELLPTGSGPDLVHHLSLIAYIEQHWRLVHDLRLSEYLGEMIDYTPGLHLLTALGGAWLRTDGLHALHPVLALTVADQGRICFSDRAPSRAGGRARNRLASSRWCSCLVPRVLVRLVHRAVLPRPGRERALRGRDWWTLIVWDERPARGVMALFGVFGVGAFLTWPVWTGPLLLVLASVALLPANDPLPTARSISSSRLHRLRWPWRCTARATRADFALSAPAALRCGRPPRREAVVLCRCRDGDRLRGTAAAHARRDHAAARDRAPGGGADQGRACQRCGNALPRPEDVLPGDLSGGRGDRGNGGGVLADCRGCAFRGCG